MCVYLCVKERVGERAARERLCVFIERGEGESVCVYRERGRGLPERNAWVIINILSPSSSMVMVAMGDPMKTSSSFSGVATTVKVSSSSMMTSPIIFTV